MKIAIVPSSDLSYNSGSIIYAKSLYKYLIDEGHQVYILGSKMPTDIDSEYMKNIIIKKDLLEHPIIDDRNISNEEYLKMFYSIVDFILETDQLCGGLDIIHAHYISINSYASIFASKLINVPVVVSSFGRDINMGYKKDLRIKKMILSSVNEVNGIIAADKNIKSFLEKSGYLIDKKTEIIGMPIDYSIFDEGESVVNNQGKIIISSINSCFSEEKGIEKIIDAFEKVSKEYNDILLYIAGTDDHPQKVHEKRIKKLIEKYCLQEKVVLVGFLERNRVGMLLKESDIYIDARENSNFSSVLLEAMTIGVPIIASRNEGSCKVIENNFNGLLFDCNSINDLSEKLKILICDKQLRLNIVNNGFIWLKNEGEKYLPENCFGSVLKFYGKIQEEYNND